MISLELVDFLARVKETAREVDAIEERRIIYADFSKADLLERWVAVLLDPLMPTRDEESSYISKILRMSEIGRVVLRENE